MKSNNKKGFTLIELLVVVAIIGLLASVVLGAVNSGRTKARDAQRKSDIRQIVIALELYYDTYGVYPTASGATAPGASWANSADSSWETLATALNPFLPSLAKDPLQTTDPSIWAHTGFTYSYLRCSVNNSYMLVYHLEEAKGPDPGTFCNATFYRYGGTGANTYVKTIGAKSS
jgi:prepilin-type N-terminal cleavage/methylation domain-containing protein